jgi:hypothetical protein
LKGVNEKTEVGLELTYTALVAFPDLEDSRKFLLENGYDVSVEKLRVLKTMKGRIPGKPGEDMYVQKRKELAPTLEKIHADDLLDQARECSAIVDLALTRTREKLEAGEVADPSRVARDLSQVQTQAIDKRMLLEDRPTEIRAVHTTDELIVKLEGLKVLERVDAEATAIEE